MSVEPELHDESKAMLQSGHVMLSLDCGSRYSKTGSIGIAAVGGVIAELTREIVG